MLQLENAGAHVVTWCLMINTTIVSIHKFHILIDFLWSFDFLMSPRILLKWCNFSKIDCAFALPLLYFWMDIPLLIILISDTLHSKNQILGICPGDKIPSLENELWCTCPSDSIEVDNDKCVVCNGEVPNAEQTACVGMIF